ncbi:MAG: rod shape-determining protein MreC, partial [Streptococcaceae bacterium]|nr:rod shape-determining protein MreC [Streptococcaceae bacterium]
MKKFNFSKLLITALIILVTAILAVIISVQNYKNHRQPSVMTQMINDGTGWVDGFVGAPIRYVQDKSNQIDDMLHAYQQNESLKSELVASQPDKDKLDAIQSENKQLKDALKLKDTLTNYDTISATVISRDPNSWDDTLTINSGKQDGLVDNMVVMANGGVIGRISQVNQNSSKVALF